MDESEAMLGIVSEEKELNAKRMVGEAALYGPSWTLCLRMHWEERPNWLLYR